ncbi:MAG: ABC transporter ATP-binding protein, partial [Eubacteriales bacterium]
LLDEPTANLDFGNQHRILQLLRNLTRQGYTVLLSSHDPNQTLQYGDVAVVLEGKQVTVKGQPAQVLTAPVLSSIYHLPITIQDGYCAVEVEL